MKGIIAGIVLCVIVVSCSNGDDKASSVGTQAELQVKAYKVLPQHFENVIRVSAELMPNEQLEIMAPISGQVLDIYFKEGEAVNAGAPILRIDDRAWQAQISGVQASLDAAEKTYQRKKALLDIEGSSQEDLDQAFSEMESLRSQLKSLRINIELANVKAPFAGRLGMRNFSRGAFLKEGEVITTLTELSRMKVDFSLPQEYGSDIKLGKEVAVLVSGDTIYATVYVIDPVIDARSRTIKVRAAFRQRDQFTIMPGTFAEVLVSNSLVEDALLVPTQAVVPEINDQTLYLYKNGVAVRRTISMGNRTADMVRVQEGIIAGDTVITTGLLQVKDGMKVKLQEVK